MTKGFLLATISPKLALKDDKSEFYKRFRQIGILTSIPFILVAGPLVGYFAGSWIDRKFGTEPTVTFVFIVLGVLASMREMVRIIKEVLKQENE